MLHQPNNIFAGTMIFRRSDNARINLRQVRQSVQSIVSRAMKTITRRKFLNSSITAGLALGMPRIVIGAEGSSRSPGSNDTVRVAVIGLGSTTAAGGVGGRGHQLIPRIREVPGAKIVALCDVDQAHLDREAQPFKDPTEEVATYHDLRRVFDDKTIDAVVIAL